MKFVFQERKAAEAAAHLLQLGGGRMPYMKLLKLMYLADRRTLIETGFPITGDGMVAMKHGTNLSAAYDRAKKMHPIVRTPWTEHVGPPEGKDKEVRLRQPAPTFGKLSRYEIRILSEIYDEHGWRSQWELGDLTHALPEYRDPQGSSTPIDPGDILKHQLKSDEKVARRVKLAESFYEIEKRQVSHRS
jgi:uncharacterized phage-associated protein